MMMHESIDNFCEALRGILGDRVTAIYLYGSVALQDFREGWSDIDLLCLTRNAPSESEAEQLVELRQKMTQDHPTNPYFRMIEGAVVAADELKADAYTRVVYWGTSGQRVTDRYSLDVFSRYEWLADGILLYGEDVRRAYRMPDYRDLREGVRLHLQAIRTYARVTDEQLYSCGWLLDIARGLYTLRHGTVIAKTAAGEWALEKKLCPDGDAMEKALQVRRSPLVYKSHPETRMWLRSLGPTVQAFADILEEELISSHIIRK